MFFFLISPTTNGITKRNCILFFFLVFIILPRYYTEAEDTRYNVLLNYYDL